MLTLPTVTLVIVDCVDATQALKALAASLSHIQPAAALLLSHEAPLLLDCVPAVRHVAINRLYSCSEYNAFMLFQLYKYVSTEFCLSIQTDGFVLNGAAWQQKFLQYDYVGAPWPAGQWDGFRVSVGNSGFCLRSRKLLELTARLPGVFPQRQRQAHDGKLLDDVVTCYTALPYWGTQLSIAPVDVAWQFSREQPLFARTAQPFSLAGAFGFHGQLTPETAGCCRWLRDSMLHVCQFDSPPLQVGKHG